MQDVPLPLPPVTSNERTQCQVRPDSGLAIAAFNVMHLVAIGFQVQA